MSSAERIGKPSNRTVLLRPQYQSHAYTHTHHDDDDDDDGRSTVGLNVETRGMWRSQKKTRRWN